MTFSTNRPLAASLTSAPSATAVDQDRPLIARGLLRRATTATGDLLAAVSIVVGIPFVILAVGLPIALAVRFLLWVAGMR